MKSYSVTSFFLFILEFQRKESENNGKQSCIQSYQKEETGNDA